MNELGCRFSFGLIALTLSLAACGEGGADGSGGDPNDGSTNTAASGDTVGSTTTSGTTTSAASTSASGGGASTSSASSSSSSSGEGGGASGRPEVTAMPRSTAGRADSSSNQRLKYTKSLMSWPCVFQPTVHG